MFQLDCKWRGYNLCRRCCYDAIGRKSPGRGGRSFAWHSGRRQISLGRRDLRTRRGEVLVSGYERWRGAFRKRQDFRECWRHLAPLHSFCSVILFHCQSGRQRFLVALTVFAVSFFICKTEKRSCAWNSGFHCLEVCLGRNSVLTSALTMHDRLVSIGEALVRSFLSPLRRSNDS